MARFEWLIRKKKLQKHKEILKQLNHKQNGRQRDDRTHWNVDKFKMLGIEKSQSAHKWLGHAYKHMYSYT